MRRKREIKKMRVKIIDTVNRKAREKYCRISLICVI